jgi:hypothetical protein
VRGSFLYEFSQACAIYRSDVGLNFAQRSTGVPPPVGRHRESQAATEIAPLLIVRDESHRLSLGGLLSSRARLRFAGCVQFAMKEYGRSRNFQRTANSVLTVCVSSGDKRKALGKFAGLSALIIKRKSSVNHRAS